jgi:hypothetical protein
LRESARKEYSFDLLFVLPIIANKTATLLNTVDKQNDNKIQDRETTEVQRRI